MIATLQTNFYKIFIFLLLFFCNANIFGQQKKTVAKSESLKTKTEKPQNKPEKTIAVQDTILNIVPTNDSIRMIGAVILKLHQRNAHASYYADKFTGRRTASGTRFDNQKYTCAHRKLPFGTKLKVTCDRTKKSTIVIVTDRGPFVRGRDIDLSKKSFMDIAPSTYGGSIAVTIEIVKK